MINASMNLCSVFELWIDGHTFVIYAIMEVLRDKVIVKM